MTLAWWQLAALALLVMVAGKTLVVAYRNGWEYLPERGRELWWTRPRPLTAWRSQDQWQRRRQALTGLVVASVAAMLLAVALRGIFVPVFFMTLALVSIAVLFAVTRGAIELRRGPQTVARQLADIGHEMPLHTGPYAETGIFADRGALPKINVGPVDGPPPSIDSDATPLMFEPLGIDPAQPVDEAPADTADSAETLPMADPQSDVETGIDDDSDGGTQAGSKPSFSAAPAVGRHQASARARSRKRGKARPIYIESVLDGDETDGPEGRATGKAADGG